MGQCKSRGDDDVRTIFLEIIDHGLRVSGGSGVGGHQQMPDGLESFSPIVDVCVQTNGGWRQEVCQVNHRGGLSIAVGAIAYSLVRVEGHGFQAITCFQWSRWFSIVWAASWAALREWLAPHPHCTSLAAGVVLSLRMSRRVATTSP